MPEEVGKPIFAGPTQMDITPLARDKRRLVRSFKNPLDKCTVVSIYPRTIDEIKPTIDPARFIIPEGSYEQPGCLTVGTSSWWKDIDAEQPLVEIPVSSVQIAESVVKDFCNGMIGCNMADAMPGLFFVLGEHKSLDIVAKYRESLNTARTKQDNWYRVLIKLADSLFARTNGNPLAIGDEMRIAAKSLGVDKPWLKDFNLQEQVKCAACGSLKQKAYPVCPVCKAIDMDNPLSKDLKFAV